MNTPLDEFDLEKMRAGAPTDPEVARRLEDDPAFGPARDEIAAMQQWWQAHRPPLPAPARPPVSSRRGWWVAASGGMALLAAALLALQAPVPTTSSNPIGVQARGAPAVDVARDRDGTPLGAHDPVQVGDVLGLSLVVDEPAFVSVYTVQEDGGVSVLVAGQPATPSEAFSVAGIALDAYAGREWLVVDTSATSPPPDALATEAAALLPHPRSGPDRFVVEVTRGGPLR